MVTGNGGSEMQETIMQDQGGQVPVEQRALAPTERMTQAERVALSDQRMFDAAIELIIKHGTQGTTLKAIGELAGYSRGLANSRFGSKEIFLRDLFMRFDSHWKFFLRSYTDNKTGIQAMKAAIAALREFMRSEPTYMRAMYILWYESLGHASEIRTRLATNHNSYRKDASRWIREGIESGDIDPAINPEQFAVQYCSLIFGTVYQWLVDAEALDLDEVFAHYEQAIIKLLSNRS
jgi:AcrR family transcriptional regulator